MLLSDEFSVVECRVSRLTSMGSYGATLIQEIGITLLWIGDAPLPSLLFITSDGQGHCSVDIGPFQPAFSMHWDRSAVVGTSRGDDGRMMEVTFVSI